MPGSCYEQRVGYHYWLASGPASCLELRVGLHLLAAVPGSWDEGELGLRWAVTILEDQVQLHLDPKNINL